MTDKSPCPVCKRTEADHDDARAESCDRTFAKWPQERKTAAWREQAKAVTT